MTVVAFLCDQISISTSLMGDRIPREYFVVGKVDGNLTFLVGSITLASTLGRRNQA